MSRQFEATASINSATRTKPEHHAPMTKSTGVRKAFKSRRPRCTFDAKEGARQEDDMRECKAAAVRDLRRFLLSRFATGAMPATDVCEFAYMFGLAGLEGFEDLELDPSLTSFAKNANKKIRRVSGLDSFESGLFGAPVPLCVAGDKRLVVRCPMAMIASVLAEEFALNAAAVIEASSNLQTSNWLSNTIRLDCVAKGQICVPYGLFADGAAWKGKGAGTRDSVLAFYVNILSLTNRRTICTLRKDQLCGQACRCPCLVPRL